MAPKKTKVPTPEELLEEVSGKSAAKTYPFDDYMQAVHLMQTEKGYSYADIAKFLSEKLQLDVSKGQVYRGLTLWRDEQTRLEREAAFAERGVLEEEDRSAAQIECEEEVAQHNAELEEAAAELRTLLEEHFPTDEPTAPGTPSWTYRELLEHTAKYYAKVEADEQAADRADAETQGQRKTKKRK